MSDFALLAEEDIEEITSRMMRVEAKRFTASLQSV